jgi:hypothetical protein
VKPKGCTAGNFHRLLIKEKDLLLKKKIGWHLTTVSKIILLITIKTAISKCHFSS